MTKRPLFWAGVFLTAALAGVFLAGADDLLLSRGRTAPAPRFEEGAGLTVAGQVASCDRMPDNIRVFLNHIRIISDNNSEDSDNTNNFIHSDNSVDQSYQITFYTEEQQILPGDFLLVAGECRNFEAASNPGQFDAQEYYTAKNVLFTLKSPEILEKKEGRVSWKRLLNVLKRRLCESYAEILGDEQAAALSAITLGEKALLEDDQKRLYQEGGISHILAISGLHISLLGMGLYHLLRKCFVPLPAAAGFSGLFLVSYIEMTGWSASSRRACIMFFLWLGAELLGRAFDRLTALAFAAVCLLVTNPGLLKEAAFQLSFLSLLSLLLLASEMASVLKIQSKAGQALHSALALQAGMLPCTLYFFYQIPPWSMAVNFVVIPLMPVIMLSGLFGGLAGIFSRQAGMLLAAPCHYLLALIGQICRLEGMLPKSLLVCGRPSPVRIVLYYAVLGAASLAAVILCHKGEWMAEAFREHWDGIRTSVILDEAGRLRAALQTRRIEREKKIRDPERADQKKRDLEICRFVEASVHREEKFHRAGFVSAARCIWFAALPVCFWLMQPSRPPGLEVVCLDVGQGDGSLLRMPDGEVCMVDGGSTSERDLWDYRISQALKYYGVGEIDWWFVSHSDKDHVSGLQEYLEEYEVNLAGENVHGITLKHLVLPISAGEDETLEQLQRIAQEKGIQVHAAQHGDRIRGRSGSGEDQRADGNISGESGRRSDGGRNDSEEFREAGSVSGRDGTESAGNKGWSLECLAPDAASMTGDVNQDSLVLLLRYGMFRMLFTGDLEGQGEKQLALSGQDLAADVLKAGHHGSKNASSELFLEQVKPQLSVISRGIDNRYGHPAAETLERLEKAGSRIFDTALWGAAILRSDGAEYSLTGFRTVGTGES